MLVRFDVVSLYTKILVDEVLKVLKEITREEITYMVKVCLNSTYFTFHGEIYEQNSGVAMVSTLSLMVANLYMEYFKKKAFDSYPLNTREWKWFGEIYLASQDEKLDYFL